MCMVGRDKTKKDDYMLSCLLDMLDRGQIRKDHPLQRKADQIDNDERDGLVASMIKGEDIDPIKLCEQVFDNYVENWLIDGLQRLTTAHMFKMGAFKLGKNVEFPIIQYLVAQKDDNGNFICEENGRRKYDVVEFDLREKGYNDLPKELQDAFNNYSFCVVKQLNCTTEEIGYHIRRYNKQKSMNGAQKVVTFMDKVAGDIKKLSSHRFFKDCTAFTNVQKKNGTIERTVTESVMAINFLDVWKKNAKDQGSYLNENCTKEDFNAVNDLLDRMETCLDDRHKDLFTSKNAFLYITLFDKFAKLGVDDTKYDEFLAEWENGLSDKEIEGISYNNLDSSKSSKDKGLITDKLHIMETLMLEYLHINKEETQSEETENVSDMVENNEPSTLDFIKENVSENTTEEDLQCYEEVLDDLTLEVDNNTPLLDEQNIKSLLALVAYSFQNDIDLDKWLPDYFRRVHTYNKNSKENYLLMTHDLNKFLEKGATA